ncbi:MAG: hypothetical protein OXG08_07675 [Gammaproteobacteria bacterium]|nr:hypothetical protein [Gammaproteobacteria bacterium]
MSPYKSSTRKKTLRRIETLELSPRLPAYAACLLALALVFVAQQSSTTQEVEDIDCEGEWADSPLCIQREKAIELRARIDALLEELPDVAAPPWDSSVYEAALAEFEEGQNQYQEQFFGDAATKFESVVTELLAIKNQFEAASSEKFDAAFELLNAENYSDALIHFEQLVTWLPQSEEVQSGLERAETGTRLATVVEQIEELIQGKLLDEAGAELEEFPEQYWTSRIAKAKNRILKNRQTQSFNTLMSQGLRAFDEGRWMEAKQFFASAVDLVPDSTAAIEALADAETRLAHHNFKLLSEELEALRANEQWEPMLPILESMSQLKPENQELTATKAHIQALLDVDTRLAKSLDNMSSAMVRQERENVRKLLEESNEHIVHARIAEKRSDLAKEFERYTTPVSVTLISDRKTQVTIRPGRKLGRFSKKEISVYPGNYELVGIRRGFRETRQKISIAPDSEPIEVRVICDVKF